MSSTSSSVYSFSSARFHSIISHFLSEYAKSTPKKLQLIDRFIAFAFATGVFQFIYILLAGQFPYNSFLSGFIASVGFFVFCVCLRLQIANPNAFGNISPRRAFMDFCFCNVILFFVVVTFMG
jgi:oligosaccharyltransferase complex subunit epsilon